MDGLERACFGALVVVLCTVSRCLCSCLLALAKSSKLIEPGTSEFSANSVETVFCRRAGSLRGGYGRRWSGGALERVQPLNDVRNKVSGSLGCFSLQTAPPFLDPVTSWPRRGGPGWSVTSQMCRQLACFIHIKANLIHVLIYREFVLFIVSLTYIGNKK